MRFVERLNASLAYRIGPVANAAVERLPRRRWPATRPPSPFRLLMLVGRAQVPMLRVCLDSIVSTWSALPELHVVSDGTAPLELLQDLAARWPRPARVVLAGEVVRRVREEVSADVAAFAACSPVGLKFAAIVLSAREQPTLFTDPDILWYRDFNTEVDLPVLAGGIRLGLCEDYQAAYDDDVAGALGEDLRSALPFINSGVVLLDGDLLGAVPMSEGLRVAVQRPNHFAEQTLLAVAARRLGAPLWPSSSVACFHSDHQSLRVTYRGQPWFARHYVGTVRHLFWRDALALRLSRPSAPL